MMFVSHDLNAIVATCSRGLLIDGGRLQLDGPIREVAAAYEGSGLALASSGGLFRRDLESLATSAPVFLSVELRDGQGAGTTRFSYGDTLELVITTSHEAQVPDFSVDWQIFDTRRHPVAYGSSVLMQGRYFSPGDVIRLTIDHLPLAAGRYGIDLTALVPDIQAFDTWWTEIGFEIEESDPFQSGSSFHAREGVSPIVLRHGWRTT